MTSNSSPAYGTQLYRPVVAWCERMQGWFMWVTYAS